MQESSHKAGFVSIIGRPNVGKSTLMNALVGEKLSIITSKAQTTRHRIMGILSGPDFQIVYSDTPGVITPKYELQKSMMSFVNASLEDADVILWVVDVTEEDINEELFKRVLHSEVPVIFLLNKIDLIGEVEAEKRLEVWKTKVKALHYLPVSAISKKNIDLVLGLIIQQMPVHPPYFPADELTDKTQRFFAAEIIREKIFLHYDKEVPYSCEVAIIEFKEDKKIIRIQAEIYVERTSQRSIIIGKGGAAIKQVGIEARKDMEAFFGKQVHLETYVKVETDWRKRDSQLRKFGYNNS
ncbi:GTPase Era [Cytophagales bacterium LB-30]|uniref:GTPase Era n=1 Tax=Shiella aurantiaca TaxID=3058365 RepID=A0ABT8F5H6_9BACT|nr:GTPase Era [Shiella aurantiaca]MDN4165705.1 GTPase Era [Shiella aurantiaca]